MSDTISSTLPSVTTPKIVAVIHEIGEGVTVAQACQNQFIKVATFYNAVKRDNEVATMFAEALEVGNDVLADMLINIDKHHSDARMAGVISKNIQWVLERRAPKKFGQRVTIENGDSIASKSLAEALNKALDRIPMPANYRPGDSAIDITPKETAPPFPVAPKFREETPLVGTTEAELRALGLL